MHVLRIILVAVAGLVGIALLLVWLGSSRHRRETADLIQQLVHSSADDVPSRVHFENLSGLPDPVQKYLKLVLRDGQPCVRVARFTQRGELHINEQSDKWSSFSASQVVHAGTPGYVWDARIRIAPFLHVGVRDGYVGGQGTATVDLLSAFTIASESNRPELDSGALHRYLAEAVWYPTALLPSAGVDWSAIDHERALATLTNAGVSVSLEFRFNDIGEVVGIYTDARWGRFGERYELAPWEGSFGNYNRFQGILVPTTAEVGWHLRNGFWSFWKGSMLAIDYEFVD